MSEPTLAPFRKVVNTRDVSNKYCRSGEGCRWHHLQCGHDVVTKQSAGKPKRKRCAECWRKRVTTA